MKKLKRKIVTVTGRVIKLKRILKVKPGGKIKGREITFIIMDETDEIPSNLLL